MVICPFCSAENIDGTDVCDECQQPIGFQTRPQPGSVLEQSILRDGVYMLAPRQPVVVEADTPVAQVLDLLVDHSIGCVVVVRGDDVVGIFSERDALLRIGVDVAAFAQRPISDFMTPSPETVDRDAKIVFALHKMDIGGYRHMPVLTDSRISGMISIRDILGYITANLLATQA